MTMSDGPTQKMPQEAVAPEHSAEVPLEKGERRVGPSVERPAVTEQHPPTAPVSSSSQTSAPIAAPQKSPLLQHIENILEEDLLSLYKELKPEQRKQFRAEGERTAKKIEHLLRKAAVALLEIIRLIRRWLRLLRGTNVFFIEQESKIKAERILALKKKE